MDQLASLISNIELAIRYLLSGVAICVIYLVSLADPVPPIMLIVDHPGLSAFMAGVIGFTVYSLYRLLFWIVGDGVAWKMGLSAPGLYRSCLYHRPYARFLVWRRDNAFSTTLNGYLHYRWAVTHFTYIVAFALCFALAYRQDGSLVDLWASSLRSIIGVLFLLATWQASFLFRLERELYKRDRAKKLPSDSRDSTNETV
ncbi:hypothetical protein ACUTAH_02765 [Metapseudomonas furukawaii]|uniref:hypothetical protein n=1 Tax=Metapseudomonas furukawaii TaxID=1149133 RepID=UPI0040458546